MHMYVSECCCFSFYAIRWNRKNICCSRSQINLAAARWRRFQLIITPTSPPRSRYTGAHKKQKQTWIFDLCSKIRCTSLSLIPISGRIIILISISIAMPKQHKKRKNNKVTATTTTAAATTIGTQKTETETQQLKLKLKRSQQLSNKRASGQTSDERASVRSTSEQTATETEINYIEITN